MNSLSVALIIGFFLGVRHATDADHLVAVGAMLRRYGGLRGALFTGAAWGVGHSLTVLGVGTAMVVFGVVVPERALPFMDLAVGLMLLGLGAGTLLRATRRSTHAHDHHPKLGRGRLLRPFAVGIVHGLAGSAGVALLALTTIQSRPLAMVYLALFAIGTVAGMTLITTLLALPMRYAAGKSQAAEAWVVRGACAMSIALGAWIVGTVLLEVLGLAPCSLTRG